VTTAKAKTVAGRRRAGAWRWKKEVTSQCAAKEAAVATATLAKDTAMLNTSAM
jgi:hypothetical protein